MRGGVAHLGAPLLSLAPDPQELLFAVSTRGVHFEELVLVLVMELVMELVKGG